MGIVRLRLTLAIVLFGPLVVRVGSSSAAPPAPIRPYVTDSHVGRKPPPKRPPGDAGAGGVVLERSNGGASVEDLSGGGPGGAEVEVVPRVRDFGPHDAPPELPPTFRPREIPMDASHEGWIPNGGQDPSEWPIPSQVYDTREPSFSDGLAGNRQAALTPFPNLDIQSGPLAPHQLPWSHKFHDTKPFRVWTTMEFQTLAGTLRNNGADAQQEYGWYNSFLFAVPFWKEKGIGVQFAATVEPTTTPQLLTEFGFAAFRRALWPEDPTQRVRLMDRLSWGIGFDGVWDTEDRIFVGQQRMQLAYSVGPNRELGVWGAFSLGEDLSSVTSPPQNFATAAHAAFYYRHVFPNELDATIFVGATENPGGFLFGGYASYRFTARTAFVLQGMNNFGEDGGNSLYAGIKVYFSPLVDSSQLSGSALNRYRAYMRPPDHINLQLRQTTP